MSDWKIIEGDCRDVLRTMPAQSVHTVVTSPPYFGLRDYGTGEWEGGDRECDHLGASHRTQAGFNERYFGREKTEGWEDKQGELREPFKDVCGKCGARRVDRQIGLEPTPDEFVAALVDVFREVRRVLRDDGTVWLNLGSSYASEDGYPIKPTDAAWLAGLIDGEGCIQIHQQRREGIRDQFQLDLSVGMMTSEAVQKAYAITGLGSCHQQNRGVWDWSVRGRQTAELLRALYPFLVTKRRQAALGIMLLDHVAEQRGNRVRPLSDEAVAYREALKRSVSACNQRGEPEIAPRDPRPAQLAVKAKDDLMVPHRVYRALMDDGWYGRMDNVWSKPNPMPESVTDRPTKAHEYVFLLSKGPRYFYDADAIREGSDHPHLAGKLQKVVYHDETAMRQDGDRIVERTADRNKRSVWTVATQPYAGAHFATFPPKLIEPCVLAGAPERACGECGAPWVRIARTEIDDSRPPVRQNIIAPKVTQNGDGTNSQGSQTWGHWTRRVTEGFEPSCSHGDGSARGVVLDPFAGAGTTGLVALQHGREFVGIELSPAYARMARERIETAVRLGFRPPQKAKVIEGQGTLFD